MMQKGLLAPREQGEHLNAAEGEDGAEVPRKRAKASHTAAQQGEQHSEYQNIARLAQASSRPSAVQNTQLHRNTYGRCNVQYPAIKTAGSAQMALTAVDACMYTLAESQFCAVGFSWG